jgi:hypothetical protein
MATEMTAGEDPAAHAQRLVSAASVAPGTGGYEAATRLVRWPSPV